MTRDLDLGIAARQVRALLVQPPGARWLLLLGHGAGAGMQHPFMEDIAGRLAGRRVATLRYEYPYMRAGSRRPDHAGILEQVSRGVAEWAAVQCAEYRLAAGGKSMGGRMTSRAHAAAPLPRVERLVFLGFPLHPARHAVSRAGRPSPRHRDADALRAGWPGQARRAAPHPRRLRTARRTCDAAPRGRTRTTASTSPGAAAARAMACWTSIAGTVAAWLDGAPDTRGRP
jgi:hypothetical protein